MGLSTATISPYKMKLFKDNGINVDRLFDQMAKHHTIGGPAMDRARATSHYRKYGNSHQHYSQSAEAGEAEDETTAEPEAEEVDERPEGEWECPDGEDDCLEEEKFCAEDFKCPDRRAEKVCPEENAECAEEEKYCPGGFVCEEEKEPESQEA